MPAGFTTNRKIPQFPLNFTQGVFGGIVSSSGGGTTNFLRADGAWVAPPGSVPNPLVLGTNGGTAGQITLNGSTSGSFSITASSAGSPQYGGTATNDNAPAGDIGEYISSTVTSGSAVALTTAISANMTSISLGAGDWEVWSILAFTGGATTTVSNLQGAITTASGGFSTTPGFFSLLPTFGQTVFNGSIVPTLLVGPVRQSLPTTTTIFATALANFGTSTCSVFGILQARRPR